jgi:uncharacterized membrane protein SirB2
MDINFTLIKHVHVAVALLTFVLFVVRIAWMIGSPEQLQRRWVKIVPHAIDTVLLLSGVWLAVQLGAAGVRGWLAAKMAAVVLYILLGTIALRRGRTQRLRIAAAAGAVAMFAYIVSVAMTKSPWCLARLALNF